MYPNKVVRKEMFNKEKGSLLRKLTLPLNRRLSSKFKRLQSRMSRDTRRDYFNVYMGDFVAAQ